MKGRSTCVLFFKSSLENIGSRYTIGWVISIYIICIYRMRDKKNAGDKWEELVAQHYQQIWYHLIEKKYTIKWGEIDLIFEKDRTLFFVEVKVVNTIQDLQDYITTKKLGHVKHTIAYYLMTHPTDKEYVLDVVFVRNNAILHIYNNVTNT